MDLVELDIKMPRMDGLELLQCLREKSRIRLNFLTSKADEVDEIWGLRLGGAATIITKPFSQRLRIERIHTLLSRKFRRADDDFSEIETLYGVGYRYRTV